MQRMAEQLQDEQVTKAYPFDLKGDIHHQARGIRPGDGEEYLVFLRRLSHQPGSNGVQPGPQ